MTNVILSDGNVHTVVHHKTSTTVEVIEQTPIYLKVPSKNKSSPLRVHFEYLSSGDLKTYMSMTNTKPSEEDHSTSSGKVKKLVVYAKD